MLVESPYATLHWLTIKIFSPNVIVSEMFAVDICMALTFSMGQY